MASVRPKSASKKAKNWGENQRDTEVDEEVSIPLLDEVNELLNKEKNLMQLKVLEGRVEAKEWKEKYETLVGQISGDVLNPSRITACEVAADVTSEQKANSWHNDVEKQLYLLPTSNMPWYLDVSNIALNVDSLHRILMFPKTNSYKKITVICANNSALDDSCSKLYPHLLRFPNIQALDLSCNGISESFHAALLKAVEARRLTLQYLLLHGNMQLSNCSLEIFLHHLSNSVWGLTVSLNDTPNWTKKQAKSTSKNSDIPKLSARFLRHLNFVLDPANDRNYNNKSSSKDAKQRKIPNEFMQPHRGAGGAHGGPQNICVLGLMHATLCDESLTHLENTLELTVSSLTDLDLSYSFAGSRGAKLMGRFLQHRSCQLIRLGCVGCALNDGATKRFLCDGLKSSTTLTCLDMKSNNITDSGLLAIANALSGKSTFRKLWVEGNSLTLAAVLEARNLLTQSGSSHAHVEYGKALFGNISSVVDESEEPLILSIPHQTSITIDATRRESVLYDIESRHMKHRVAQNHNNREHSTDSESFGETINADEVCVSWNMSAWPLVTEGDDNASVSLRSHMRGALSWEIKSVSHSNEEKVLHSKNLLPDAFLPTGTLITCCACIPAPEFRSKLVISVKSLMSKQIPQSLHVRAHGLAIHQIPSSFHKDFFKFGGDMSPWGSVGNSLYSQTASAKALDELSVMRQLRWTGMHTFGVRLRFRAKLSAVYGLVESVDASDNSSSANLDPAWSTMQGASIGYAWCLYRMKFNRGRIVVAEGVVPNSQRDSIRDDNESDDNVSSLLKPWLWNDFEVDVGEATTNEEFLLCSKVISSQPANQTELRCQVTVGECSFFVKGNNFEHNKDIIYEISKDPTRLFCTFNNSSVSSFL